MAAATTKFKNEIAAHRRSRRPQDRLSNLHKRRAGSVSMKDEDVDKEFHIHPMSFAPVPPEAWQFIEEAQKASESVTGNVQEEHSQHREDQPE